jgi:hypothetical protein
LSSGFAGAAAARWGVRAARAFRSVLVLVTVTSKLEWMARRVPSGDGNKGWAWARGHNNNDATFKSGEGRERQAQVEYHQALFLSMESVLGGRGEGKGDGRDGNDGAGNNNSGSGRTGTGGIFGRVHLIYKLHGNVPQHTQAFTLCAFGDGG